MGQFSGSRLQQQGNKKVFAAAVHIIFVTHKYKKVEIKPSKT
jgi:phosphoribosylpyrophosphate synthetase